MQGFNMTPAGGGVNKTTLPPPLQAFAVEIGNATATLTWSANTDPTFASLLIVRKAGSMPTSPSDGTKIEVGTATSYVDNGLTNDVTYYWRAYPRNAKKQMQTTEAGQVVSGMPKASILLSSVPVGTLVNLVEDGVKAPYIVVNQGKPSEMYDESCNGTWLLRKEIFETRRWHSTNSNDWANSTLRSYLDSTFLARYDADIQNAIVQVKVPYRPGSSPGSKVNSGANGLSCKVCILSCYEMGLSGNQNIPPDGAKLAYFDAGTGITANNKRIGYLNGSATFWWLRSPRTDDPEYAFGVDANGDWYRDYCYNSYGVRPAVVLGNTALINPSANPDGSYDLL